MLAKKNRLTALKLKNVGRFSLYRGASFDAKKLETYEQEYACIISAKTMKKAVERNKVKRIFYRILRESIIGKDGFTQKGFLFYPKKGSVDTTSEIIKEELLRLLKN